MQVDRSTVPLPPFVISSKMAMEPKRMNLPLNITPFCRLSNRDDVLLEIKWSKESSKVLGSGLVFYVLVLIKVFLLKTSNFKKL